MIQKYSSYKILGNFFDFPTRDFQMRELSRITKISQPSVMNHLKKLVEEGLVIKEKKGIYPSYRANRDNETFKLHKKINILLRMEKSGLIDYISDLCMPNAMILFGSAAKGEDIENSDLDIFIQCKEKKTDLKKYEKMLNRNISLFFEENFSRLSNELKNNLLNGIILKGYIKVF